MAAEGERAVVVVPGHGAGERQRHQLLALAAARALMLCGAAAAVSGSAAAGTPAASCTPEFIGLLLWLLGVCLLALVHVAVAGRFPQAVLAGAAMGSAVLKHCFAPWN